jgi:hypothetical protein
LRPSLLLVPAVADFPTEILLLLAFLLLLSFLLLLAYLL